jgi:hypothetical protein
MAEDPAGVAFVEVAAPAEEAVTAGRAVGAEHPVADRDPPDRVAGGCDRADVLVAEREALLDRDPPVVDVEVRAANAACLDPDDRLVCRAELGLRHVVDTHLARPLKGHRSHPRGL